MPSRGGIARGASAAAVAASLLAVSGCGGGQEQGANERDATYRVSVPSASFPARQELAQSSELRITVRNDGDTTIPNLAATITGADGGTSIAAFGQDSPTPGQASASRPVWIVDQGPLNGDSADANTWAIGELPAGATRTFVWHVTAVSPGTHHIRYALYGSLTGKSKLQLANGETPHGAFTTVIPARAPRTRVTADGRILEVPAN